VPFAALYDADTKQRLIERLSIAVAPSAGVLTRHASRAPRSLVAMAAGSTTDAALPASAEELAELGRLYRVSIDAAGRASFEALTAAASRADVVHISGHADVGTDAALVLGADRVSWRRAASAGLRGEPLVVLAACATLRAPRSARTRALSLGAGFLAGGASGVVGTLAPIADNDARALFAVFHRHLAAGRGAAEALRQAQLEAFGDESRGGDRIAWRSVALLTRVIPVEKESGDGNR